MKKTETNLNSDLETITITSTVSTQETAVLESEDVEEYGALSDSEKKQIDRRVNRINWLIYVSIALIIAGLIFGIYRFFPFFNKLSGTWESSDYSTYQLTVSGSTADFTIQEVQTSVDMVFNGDLTRVGSNRYRMEDVKVYLDVNKEEYSESDLASLKEQENLYTVVEEDTDSLRLEYTEEAIDSAFTNNLETMFYFTLENFEYQLFGQEIRVRSEALSETSFVLERE